MGALDLLRHHVEVALSPAVPLGMTARLTTPGSSPPGGFPR
jgi:hypothetical protein